MCTFCIDTGNVTVLLFWWLMNSTAKVLPLYVCTGSCQPCALAIATQCYDKRRPTRATRAGILVKGGAPLENLGALTQLWHFDKTGTITEGKPRLTGVVTFNEVTENDLLTVVVAVEAEAIMPGGGHCE